MSRGNSKSTTAQSPGLPAMPQTFNMENINNIFDYETLFKLSNDQFMKLASEGEIITDFAPAKDYYIDENFSRLFLAYDSSVSDYFFQFEPEEDIDVFVKNSYLVHFFPKTGKVKLIEGYDEPLSKLLVNKLMVPEDVKPLQKQEVISGTFFHEVLNQDTQAKLITLHSASVVGRRISNTPPAQSRRR